MNKHIQIDIYKHKGLSGLTNLGNTCFINATLQVLSHTYELNEFLQSKSYLPKLNNICDSAMLVEWDSLRELLWRENCIISPNKFIRTLHKVAHMKKRELFTGFEQNDASEFLLFLIDCFHNALSREININISGSPENEMDQLAVKCFEMIKQYYSKDYSEIWNLFYGVHVSEISKKEDNSVLSIQPEPFFIINLPIPPEHKSPSLIDCFDLYVKGETIEQFQHETIENPIDICKKIMFWSFPTILVIDLKRFNGGLKKNQIQVHFPIENLDLSPYVVGYNKQHFKYDLYGVCNHSGGLLGGHYTSFIKNANGLWYHCNDTSVTEVKSIDSIVSPKAYVLFYRKKNF